MSRSVNYDLKQLTNQGPVFNQPDQPIQTHLTKPLQPTMLPYIPRDLIHPITVFLTEESNQINILVLENKTSLKSVTKYNDTICKKWMGHVTWWPLWRLKPGGVICMSSHFNFLEDRVPVDFIYRGPVSILRPSFQVQYSHYKDKMISIQSYIYNG